MLVAHAGHWAVGILYLMPVFAVLIALRVSIVRERRRLAEDASGPDETPAALPEDGVAGPDGPPA